MLNAFERRYPVAFLMGMAAAVAAFCYAWASFDSAGTRPLSTLSAAAFSAAAVLYMMPVLESLMLESILRPDAPFWRVRAATFWGLSWFVLTSLFNGTTLPSVDATIHLAVSGGFGWIMTILFKRQWIEDWYRQSGATLYDTDQPVWATRTGDSVLRVGWVFPLATAIWLSVFGIEDTAFAYFLFLLLSDVSLSYPLRNVTAWRERDVIVLASVACLLTGLLTA